MSRRLAVVLIATMLSLILIIPTIPVEATNALEIREKLSHDLVDTLSRVEDDELIDTIVACDRSLTSNYVSLAKETVGDFCVEGELSYFKFFRAKLKPRQIWSLTSLPWVLQIEENRADIQLLMNSARGPSGSNVDELRDQYPDLDGNMDGDIQTYSKDDIVIAILDTGIDDDHYDLDGGKVIGWYDPIGGSLFPYDYDGHGTACAGVAAGEGDGNWIYRGVAPYAALVGVKVLAPIMFPWDIIMGFDWIIVHKDILGIDIVSISWAVYYSWNPIWWPFIPLIETAVNTLAALGIFVSVAAGNYKPLLGEHTRWVAVPGTAEYATTVGASDDGWHRMSWSAWGNSTERIKPDVLAPGYRIHAPLAGTFDQYNPVFGGTSAAAPFVAGLAGLFLEDSYMHGNEGDGNSRIKHLFMASAEEPFYPDPDPPGKDNKNGAGFVDAMNAWNFLQNDISSRYTDAEDTLGESTSEQEWWHTDEPLWVADLVDGEDWYELECLETIMITVDVWGDPDVIIKIWILNYRRHELSSSTYYIDNHALAGHVTTYQGLYYVKITVLDFSGDYYDIRIHTILS